MLAPTLHLNGTDPKELLKEWKTISTQAIALAHLIDTAPVNQRDYYPQGDTAWKEAVEGWERLRAAARAIEQETCELFFHICDEIDERAARKGNMR